MQTLKVLHVLTKREIILLFGKVLIEAFNRIVKRYAVVYDTTCESNISGFNQALDNHGHEEADKLIILNSLDISTNDPFKEPTVFSPDTDIFLLLAYFYT